MMRLLTVTSDARLSSSIATAFAGRAACHNEAGIGDATRLAIAEEFDAVVIDGAITTGSGAGIIRRMRAEGVTTPVLLMLDVNVPAARIEAFLIGVDDVMSREFLAAELVVRIATLIRRCHGHSKPSVEIGVLRVDFEERRVFVHGRAVDLTVKEFAVVELLALRRGKVLSKENFLNHLYGGMNEPEVKIIDVFICKLRKKLARLGAGEMIATLRGRGYVLREIVPAVPRARHVAERVAAICLQ